MPNLPDPNAAPPVIGRYYRVPCVWTDISALNCTKRWLPIIGPRHEDAEILRFEHLHWHFDFRFFTEHLYRAIRKKHENFLLLVQVASEKNSVREFRCVRRMPTYPTVVENKNPYPFISSLENAYSSATLKSCKICPHRGLPLGGMPVKDGVVVCPGHGLAFSATTGKLVRRLTAGEPHRAHEGRGE